MKNSLSLHVQKSIETNEKREAQELSLYLDSLLEKYKPQHNMITEGLFDFLKRDENRKSFFGGLFAGWGFGGKSKTQEAMEKMYEENAKRTKDRVEKLKEALEDARIAKMQAKNAAHQSMLDQTNNKKIQDLKNLKAKYEAEKKKWDAAAKSGVRTYTEAEIMAENKRLEEMSTVIPPEEKGTIESLRAARINCFFDEDGNPRSIEDTKSMLKKMQNDSQFKDFIHDCINEANKQLGKAEDAKADDSTWTKVYEALQNQAREDVGYSVDIENSEENLKTAEANLQAYNGNLTKEEATATDKYLKERKERAFAKIQAGEDLDENDEAALKTLTKQDLADLGITDKDYSDLDIEETDNDGIDCSKIDQTKLAEKVKANNEKQQKTEFDDSVKIEFPIPEDGQNSTNVTYEDFVKKLKKIGVPAEKIPSEEDFKKINTNGTITEADIHTYLTQTDDDGKPAHEFVAATISDIATKKAQKITTKDAPKAPEGVDEARITAYADRKMKGDNNEEKKSLTEAVEKQKTLVQQKKDFKTQIKSIQQHKASMELNQELYDNVKIGDKTMREYLEDNQPLDPGESEKDGKRGIFVNGEFKERPSDPDKLADYDKERNKIIALAGEMPGDDGRHVRIATNDDGKAVAIITDKDGKETEVAVKDMPEDKAKEIANIMNTQKARESYKNKRKEIFSGIIANLKSEKDLTDEQKDLLNSLPKDFDMSSLEDLGFSKDDIKQLDDKSKEGKPEPKDKSDDDKANDDKTNNTEETGSERTNPNKVWKFVKNKTGKGGHFVKKDDPKQTISKREFMEKKRAYKEWKAKHDQTSNESLQSFLMNSILEQDEENTYNTSLSEFLFESMKQSSVK